MVSLIKMFRMLWNLLWYEAKKEELSDALYRKKIQTQ